jgi:hypothetical protein
MGALLNFMGPPFLMDAQKHFDFWTEEENIRFVNAIESVKFPPDFNLVCEFRLPFACTVSLLP